MKIFIKYGKYTDKTSHGVSFVPFRIFAKDETMTGAESF